jgi:hypothetical protein
MVSTFNNQTHGIDPVELRILSYLWRGARKQTVIEIFSVTVFYYPEAYEQTKKIGCEGGISQVY